MCKHTHTYSVYSTYTDAPWASFMKYKSDFGRNCKMVACMYTDCTVYAHIITNQIESINFVLQMSTPIL